MCPEKTLWGEQVLAEAPLVPPRISKDADHFANMGLEFVTARQVPAAASALQDAAHNKEASYALGFGICKATLIADALTSHLQRHNQPSGPE
jgi:hypothetical protein